MLKNIIDLLQIDDFYEGNHDIQVAKGLYNLEKGIKGIFKQKKSCLLYTSDAADE